MNISEIVLMIPSYLANSTTLAVIITDLESNYLYFNETFRKNFFYETEILGKSALLTIAPEDRNIAIETVKKCLQYPEKTFSLYLHKQKSEQKNFSLTHWEFSAFKNKEGEVCGILGIGYDVSFFIESQEKIKKSENKLRALLESSEHSQVLISPDFKVLLYNKKAQELSQMIFNKNVSENDNFLEYILPEAYLDFIEAFKKAMQGETIELEQEREFQGKKLWLKMKYAPVYDENGNVLGVSLSTFDIDEKKRMRDKLKSSETKLRAIIDSTNDNNILIGTDYKILSFNRRAFENVKKVFGAEMKEGEDFRKYVVPSREKDFQNYTERALQGETIVEEVCIEINEKEKLWFLVSFFPAYDTEGNLIGVSYNACDIDKRKKYELLLEKQNMQLREIAYVQSHKVRKPVANILGLIQLINPEEMSEENRKYFNFLIQATQELDTIVHEVIDKVHEVQRG